MIDVHKMKNKVVQILMGIGMGSSMQIDEKESYVLNPMRVLKKRGFDAEIWTLQKGDMESYKEFKIRRFSNIFSMYFHLLFDRDIKIVYAQLRSHLPSLLSPLSMKKCILVTQTYELGSSWLRRRFSLFFMGRFTRIFALTPYERDLYIKNGLKKDRVLLFPHAVDYPFFSEKPGNLDATRKKYGIDKGDFVITSVANFRKFKNLDVMVSAFAEFHSKVGKSKLLIVGKDQTKNPNYKEQHDDRYSSVQDVSEIVKKKEISKDVIFTGGVDYKIVRDLLHISDIFVNVSDPEGMGIAVYEAAAAGLPLCLSDIGSFTSVFGDKVLYSEPRDTDKLAKNYFRYYKDGDLRENNSSFLRNKMKEWDYEVAVKRFNEVFDEILS